MGRSGPASARLRIGLALAIAVNAGVAMAGLGTVGHRGAPEVALPLTAPVEVPSAPPNLTPVAPPTTEGTATAVSARRASTSRRSTTSTSPPPTVQAVALKRNNATALTRWRAALADRNNHPADVVVVGDSITEGYFIGDQDRWIDRMRDDLRASYPTSAAGGEGYIPAWHVGRALDHKVPEWTQRWTLTNFPQDWNDSGDGLGRRALEITDARQSASITVKADRVWLTYTEGPDDGLLQITVDNGLPTLVNTNAKGVRSGRVWDSGPLPAGNHTVTVAVMPGNKAVVDGIMPFLGDGGGGADFGRGVRVWDGGHSKYTTAEFAESSHWADGFDTMSPDLVIIELGTNDDYFARPPDQVRANVVRIIDTIRQQAKVGGRPIPSVAVMPVWARGDKTVAEWQRYRAALIAAADDRGAAVLDAFNEVNQAPAQPTPGSLFMDLIHPSLTGHHWLGDVVTRLLAA